ncbi:MAG TPA: hypothetical protein VGX03_12465 [Candidatus Binatia bacterium]|nr:hypothetical protein [Candidatus Binatia bacterium]
MSEDNTAALITAGFWEEGVNFRNLYERLVKLRQTIEADGKHRAYITRHGDARVRRMSFLLMVLSPT